MEPSTIPAPVITTPAPARPTVPALRQETEAVLETERRLFPKPARLPSCSVEIQAAPPLHDPRRE